MFIARVYVCGFVWNSLLPRIIIIIQAMIVIIYSVAIEAKPNMPLLFSVYSIQSKCFLAEIAVSDKTAYCGINCWIFPYGDQ